MKERKSIFSYMILAAFALLCGFSIFCILETADFARTFGWPGSVLIGGICIYLLLTAAVFTALRTIFAEIGECVKDRERAEAVLAVVLPILIMLGTVVYLVCYLMYHIPVMLHDDTFYRMALVTEGNSITYNSHGASALYVILLHGLFLIFGNTFFAGVVLQIVLFFISLLLLYFGMQAYAGAIPAAAAIAAFGFFPLSIECVFSLTPDLLYIALYLFGFYLIGGLYRKFCRSGINSLGQYLLLFFAGLYAGFLACLDIYGISLFFFLIVWYSADKEKNKQALKADCIMLLSGTAGFFLTAGAIILLAGNYAGGGSLVSRFGVFLGQSAAFYLEKGNLPGNDILQAFTAYVHVPFVFSILLVSLAFFIVPAVFLQRKSPDSAFVLNLFFLYSLIYFGFTGLQGETEGILCWCMLAGLGIYGAVRPSGKKQEKDSADTEIKEDFTAQKKREQKKPAPGEPLSNPLPLPEKKRRPQADFAYAVADADMKFDIEVADNDEFDV